MCRRDSFAADLYRMYSMYAEKHGWKIELLNYNDTELGGVKEADFILNGAGAWSRLKFCLLYTSRCV